MPYSYDLFGLERHLFLLKMRAAVFFHYLGKLFEGEIEFRKFPAILSRLLRFSRKQKHAKFMRLPSGVRMGLYIPSYPGKPFIRSSESMCMNGTHVGRISAVVSISSKCNCNCSYCYQKLDQGDDLPLETLLKTVKELQDDGVAIFIIEGGDPFLEYDRLKAVCETIDDRSEIWINTTGDGVTHKRLLELKTLGLTALKISVHHCTEKKHDSFLKRDGAWKKMRETTRFCRELKIPFCMNSVMVEKSYDDGHFERMMELGKEWKASYIQLLTPRSVGGNIGHDSISFSEGQLNRLEILITKYNRGKEYREYPAIFSDEWDERMIIGCTAGGAGRIYINARGEVQPCQHINVSFGNVKDKPYSEIIPAVDKIFSSPAKHTACTLIAETVADEYKKSKVLPVPFNRVKEQWITLRKEEECRN